MDNIITKEQYRRTFSGYPSDYETRERALTFALDTRKFEINLYWQRTTYYWALIGATFAGYFLLKARGGESVSLIIYFVLGCFGFILSCGWYLSNRGSKYWQENWERHVDVLENEFMVFFY